MLPDPSQVPGMVTPVEQELLRDVAVGLDLQPGETVCEFGAFFGRSTLALACGLLDAGIDPAGRSGAALVTHDLFACADQGMFQHFVRRHAAEAGVSHLLHVTDGRLDFLPVFDHFVGGLPPGLVERRRTGLAQARHDGRPIAAMHVDAPKWHEEYVHVLREFGPALRPGALVVFQDFFYHWSATLIAMVRLMQEEGVVEPLETASTSLLVRLRKPLPAAQVARLEAAYAASDPVALVGRALDAFGTFDVQWAGRFVPRIALAGCQLARERQDARGERDFRTRFADALTGADRLAAEGLGKDLAELERLGWSLRRIYELDLDDTLPRHAA